MQRNAIPDTPTEPDWPGYAQRLEAEVAGLTVENLRLHATIETLSGHVTELRAAAGAEPDDDDEVAAPIGDTPEVAA